MTNHGMISFFFQTACCNEIGSLTSQDACNSGASSNIREPISLHRAVLYTSMDQLEFYPKVPREGFLTCVHDVIPQNDQRVKTYNSVYVALHVSIGTFVL